MAQGRFLSCKCSPNSKSRGPKCGGCYSTRGKAKNSASDSQAAGKTGPAGERHRISRPAGFQRKRTAFAIEGGDHNDRRVRTKPGTGRRSCILLGSLLPQTWLRESKRALCDRVAKSAAS